MIDPNPTAPPRLAAAMAGFALRCAETMDRSLLVDGVLPPVVRGHRLGHEQRDGRPHMGGSDAENGAHFAAFLAMLRHRFGADALPGLDDRVFRSVAPYLAQRLVPFPHRAVLQTLAVYGPLSSNALWARLDDATRAAAEGALLDVTSYYDPDAERMRTLPDNYLWITAENARFVAELQGEPDGAVARMGRSALRRLLAKLHEEAWFDDVPPWVVVDQYAWETVAAAARLCGAYGRRDELERLAPLLERYRDVLHRLAREDGYAVCWGRSQGVISYGTTIYAALAFGSALARLGRLSADEVARDVALAERAFATLVRDWFDADGLTTMHRHGRAAYSYRGPHRLVGSTFGMLVKLLHFAADLDALASLAGSAGIEDAPPERPPAAPSAHWEPFRSAERSARRRAYGVWTARSGAWHVTLPVVGNGEKFDPRLSSNYLPAPQMPFVLDVPTQQPLPYGSEFLELADGAVVSASDGCDEVEADGLRLALRWRRFLDVATLAYRDDVGTLELEIRLEGNVLTRRHVFAPGGSEVVHRYALLGVALGEHRALGERRHAFAGPGRTLELRVAGDLRRLLVEDVRGLPAGRGFLGAIPWSVGLHLPPQGGATEVALELRAETADGGAAGEGSGGPVVL